MAWACHRPLVRRSAWLPTSPVARLVGGKPPGEPVLTLAWVTRTRRGGGRQSDPAVAIRSQRRGPVGRSPIRGPGMTPRCGGWLTRAVSPAANRRAGSVSAWRDIERFRATVDMFVQLDDRFGGGHARASLIQYLSTDAERLLRGQYTDSAGRALFSAMAEATLLAAWMSYDSMPGSALAQRYFIQALALAQAGDDRLLGASVLDAMSHQATYLGRFGEAANLARAAAPGTQGVATPTLTSHFHAMEARALARMGDAKGCDRALAEAVREFERRRPDNDPAWIQYFDESELSAEFGHCLRDLGRATEAAQYASRSVAAVDDTTFLRSDFFATMVLADAHAGAGEIEQACGVALKALTAGEQIRSARCVNYLREFGQRLATAGNSNAIADFTSRLLARGCGVSPSRSGTGLAAA